MHDLYCYTPLQELLEEQPWYQAANGHTRMRFQITAAWFHWYLMKFFGSATFRYRLLSGKRAESSPVIASIEFPGVSKRLCACVPNPANFDWLDAATAAHLAAICTEALPALLAVPSDDIAVDLLGTIGHRVVIRVLMHMLREAKRPIVTDAALEAALQTLCLLRNQTYEGQPAEVAIAFPYARRQHVQEDGQSFSRDILRTKKTRRLLRGCSHILLCDREGMIVKLQYVDPTWKRDSVFWNVAPMRFVSLLQHTRRHSALGAVLSARGELLVLFGGRILYSWDGTRWQVYPGQVIAGRLLREFAERHTGCSHSINEHVGRYLMTLALTLRDERLGGLLIWTHSEDALQKVLTNSLATETAAERYYAGLFLGKHVCSIPPMLLSNVASLDGAVVVDCSGIVRGIGKLFSSSGKRFEGEGARTRAAGFASQFGILLKVSQDGEVDLYSDGVRIAQGFETTL